jgi:GMP synthase (glutamine-hydrolysing)
MGVSLYNPRSAPLIWRRARSMDPIVIIQHEDANPPGSIARYLALAGLPFEVRHVGRGDALPSSPADFSALIVLGGDMNTHENDKFPFLQTERDLVLACLRAEAPLLGICLGAQQLATAAGGEVYHRMFSEIGWTQVDIVSPDPLMVGVTSPFVCLEWHDYSFRLPPGALRIAAREDGEQVFRMGRRAWGMQFHPEVDADVAELWTAADEQRLDADRPGWAGEIRAETNVYMPAYPRFCGRLIGNFLEACGLVLHVRPE